MESGLDETELLIISAIEQDRANLMKFMDLAGMSATTFQYLAKVPRKPRLGSFWEEDVPKNSDKFFKDNFRLNRSAFNVLVKRLPNLREKDFPYRLAIPLEKQIAIALYTLGSSSDFITIGNLFGVSKAMVCRILTRFCREVIKQLAGDHLPPDFLTQEKITETIKGFETIGFPQCFGAMGGCHIEISPKSENEVDYQNSKGWYSTILFALVDFRYRFSYISVGSPGSSHDSKIFEKSNLKRKLLESNLVKKNSKFINGVEVPILVLGDSGFRFSKNVMKPYRLSWQSTPEQKAFNYHHSRIRLVVENAFVHLKARFQRIGKGLDSYIENPSLIIACCCILHNFCIDHNCSINDNWPTGVDQEQHEQPEREVWIGNTNESAECIRQALGKHFINANS